jgi:glycosyltransferase involved in cell wall biosynthesis
MSRTGGGISLRIRRIVGHILKETPSDLVLLCGGGISYDDTGLDPAFQQRVAMIGLNADAMGPSEACYETDMNVIPDVLKEHEVDVFHACANWGISSPKIIPPSLLTVHDVIPFTVREGPYQDDQLFDLYMKLISSSLRNATRIVSVSEYSKQAMAKKFSIDADKITVIPNGIDHDVRVEDYKGKCAAMLAEHSLTEDRYFVYIGGFYERKNVMRMVEAFRMFLDDHPGYKLAITGVSDSSDYVKRRFAMFQDAISDMGDSVVYVGYVSRDDLNALIANASALVYPSISEGFGIPILEAMHFEVPALCADNTVLPEIGLDAAVYFDPFDVEAMTKSMADIVTDAALRDRIVSAGKKRANDFGWQSTCGQIYDIYEELVGC